MSKKCKVRISHSDDVPDYPSDYKVNILTFGQELESDNPDFEDGDVLVISFTPKKIIFTAKPDSHKDDPSYIPRLIFELKLHSISEEAKSYVDSLSELKSGDIGLKNFFELDRARGTLHATLAYRAFQTLEENRFEVSDNDKRFYFCKSLISAWFEYIGQCENFGITTQHPYVGSFKPFVRDYKPC